jgi:hypothetical protein
MNATYSNQRGTTLAALAAGIAVAAIAAATGFWFGTRHAPALTTKGEAAPPVRDVGNPAPTATDGAGRKVLWHDRWS